MHSVAKGRKNTDRLEVWSFDIDCSFPRIDSSMPPLTWLSTALPPMASYLAAKDVPRCVGTRKEREGAMLRGAEPTAAALEALAAAAVCVGMVLAR